MRTSAISIKLVLTGAAVVGLCFLIYGGKPKKQSPLQEVTNAGPSEATSTNFERRRLSPFKAGSNRREPAARGDGAGEPLVLLQNHFGAIETMKRTEFEEIEYRDQVWLGQARAERLKQGLDVEVFRNEDQLREAATGLSPQMDADAVLRVLGNPNRIEIPRSRPFNQKGAVINDTILVSAVQEVVDGNEFFFTYCPRKDSRSAMRPRDCVQTLYVRFDTNKTVRFWAWKTPQVSIWVD